MKRGLLIGAVIATVFALLGGSASAAVAVPARYQLRGHLPELGERPTMRVFVTQAEYDTYRNSLGDANVFPPTTALFMSFDKDVLALYTRGNDTGGRCIGTQIAASFSGDTLAATAAWRGPAGRRARPTIHSSSWLSRAARRTGPRGCRARSWSASPSSRRTRMRARA